MAFLKNTGRNQVEDAQRNRGEDARAPILPETPTLPTNMPQEMPADPFHIRKPLHLQDSHSATQTTRPLAPKTLFGLTDLGNDGHAATEAIKYLLQAVGRDVVSFQRNTHVSYMVVERARDIVEAINQCIFKVENDPDGDWVSFDKFTGAIEPLEE
jgi:hypothetical protein